MALRNVFSTHRRCARSAARPSLGASLLGKSFAPSWVTVPASRCDALNRNDTIPKTRVQVEPKWPASCVFVSVSLGANVVERSSGVPGPSTLTETGIALVSTLSKWYKWRQTVTVLIRHHPRATRNRRDISPTHHRSIPCSFLSPPAILDFTIDLSSLHCPTHRTRHSIII
jgi:hypothetical protein